ncbi:MAG: ATP-grasp domain-containing protein [Pseudonocardiaceae bacterium]
MPGDALALAPHRDSFAAAGTVLVCPDAALIGIACDKWRTMVSLRQAGLPVPASRLVHGPDDLVAAAHDLGYPDHDLVVKPRSSAGSTGVWTISERSGLLQQDALPTLTLGAIGELCATAVDVPWPEGLILQRRVIGSDVSVDVFALGGRVVAGGCRSRRLSIGGLCVGGEVYPLIGALRETISRLVEALTWVGVANIQMIIGASGAQTIYEINPRLSGSIDVNALGGLDLLGGVIEYARTARSPWDDKPGALTTITEPVSFLRHWATHSWINS